MAPFAHHWAKKIVANKIGSVTARICVASNTWLKSLRVLLMTILSKWWRWGNSKRVLGSCFRDRWGEEVGNAAGWRPVVGLELSGEVFGRTRRRTRADSLFCCLGWWAVWFVPVCWRFCSTCLTLNISVRSIDGQVANGYRIVCVLHLVYI